MVAAGSGSIMLYLVQQSVRIVCKSVSVRSGGQFLRRVRIGIDYAFRNDVRAVFFSLNSRFRPINPFPVFRYRAAAVFCGSQAFVRRVAIARLRIT